MISSKKLFAEYAIQHPISIGSSTSSTLASNNCLNNVCKQWWWGRGLERSIYIENEEKKHGEEKRNEFERYLKDGLEEDSPGFDILAWWEMKATKYHVLSFMARDIL